MRTMLGLEAAGGVRFCPASKGTALQTLRSRIPACFCPPGEIMASPCDGCSDSLTEYCSDLQDSAQGRRRRRQDSEAFEGSPRTQESGQFAGLPNTEFSCEG